MRPTQRPPKSFAQTRVETPIARTMASLASPLQSSFCTPSRSFSSQASVRASPSFGRLHSSGRLHRICCEAKPETLQKVIEIVTKQLATNAEKVKPESEFADLGADSLDQVEIVMALEEEFKITVDDDGAEAISTVQEAAELIERTVSKAARQA